MTRLLRQGLMVAGLGLPLLLLGCDNKDSAGVDTGPYTSGDDGGNGGNGGPGGGGPGGGAGGPGGGDDTDGTTGGAGDGGGPGGTEPEATPYGPDNSWYHAMSDEIPEGLAGTGRDAGDIAQNFTLLDQNGDEVELYQFYGQVIVIDAFAEW